MQRDPRLSLLLADYPDDVFDDRLHASIEIADRAALIFAVIAARDIGILSQLETPRSAAWLSQTLGLAKGFSAVLEWLLERLETAGILAVMPDANVRRYRLVEQPPDSDPAQLRAAAMTVDPANAATFDLLQTAASAYPALARGEIAGRDVVLNPENVELWLRYFANTNPLYAVNNWVSATAAVKRLDRCDRQGRGVRILEVGAGAGSGSERLLDLLERRGLLSQVQTFHVTELSAFLRRKARRGLARFRTVPLTFASLDINQPWEEQEAKEASFDLIYAVNVLHVAHDLGFSLTQARKCLAPGGWLVAGECLRPSPHAPLYVELIFRLLEDPAVVTDALARPNAGFLEWRHWQAALQAAGFSTIETDPDHERILELCPNLFIGAVCGQN
ncbi:MAG: class I SAM-dependent methyltransferase [Rhodospirillales bacterium]|nr:class I SAM-dependent methyltransferase [Rhodospirillales bacterium]